MTISVSICGFDSHLSNVVEVTIRTKQTVDNSLVGKGRHKTCRCADSRKVHNAEFDSLLIHEGGSLPSRQAQAVTALLN